MPRLLRPPPSSCGAGRTPLPPSHLPLLHVLPEARRRLFERWEVFQAVFLVLVEELPPTEHLKYTANKHTEYSAS